MSGEKYKHLMDAIEAVHEENIWILKKLLKMTEVSDDISDTFINELSEKFKDIRSDW